MPAALSVPHRILIAILTLGAAAQVVQAVLIREGLVIFHGNELSLGAFYGTWLFWLAAGSLLVIRRRGRRWVREPIPALRLTLLLLPLLLLVQVLALRSLRATLGIAASELVPLGTLLVSLSVITIPTGLALGISFPLACRALEQSADAPGTTPTVARLYVADALGALLGGVVFTFVLVQWLGLGRITAVLAVALALCAWSLPGRRRWPAALFAALALGILALPATDRLEARLESARFASLQPGLELIATAQTRYGHLALGRLGEQISVVSNGQVSESFPNPTEIRREAAYFLAQTPDAGRVLVLGGLAGGLPGELLRYPLEHLTVIEQDRRAFEKLSPLLPAPTRAALADPRLELLFADARGWLNRLAAARRYDLILNLSASPATAQGNRLFTRDFYARILAHLAPDGVFCTNVGSASNYLGSEVAGYTGSVWHTLGSVLPERAIVPGDALTICASPRPGRLSEDPGVLEARYLATELADHDLPPQSFANLLDSHEVAFVRGQLDNAPAEINTDAQPVTYYLNMLLWGRYSGSGLVDWLSQVREMGLWPYLLPPVLFVVLWLLRRAIEPLPPGAAREQTSAQAATLAIALLGVIAMAAQLTFVLGYQSQVGFIFERIALLNGVFMTGLALGAGAGTALARGRHRRAALLGDLALVAALLAGLPATLSALGAWSGPLQETGYLALALLIGLVTGCGFPLGVGIADQARAGIVRSGGISAAADNLGGALGGLVTGALMLPLLGTGASCRVLAMLALVAMVPLLAAPALARRAPAAGGHAPSSALSTLGWALLYLTLLVYGWHLIQRGTEPGPRLELDADRLAEIAPERGFSRADEPFLHYLGTPGGSTQPDSALLASMAAVSGVSGYAGPINLALGIDRNGQLLGVRYLESGETPAYIAGIHRWLGSLAGMDLADAPLTLERVDGISGATVTSRAVLETINRAAAITSRAAFGTATPPEPESTGVVLGVGFWATLALLIAALAVHLSGNQRARLALLAASLAVLGLWLNTPITEIDLANLSLGNAASPAENPQRWLLLGFAAVTALLFGPIWCGMLCPFGALQELASRLGRLLGVRSYPDRRIDRTARFIRILILAGMLIAVWSSGDPGWAYFDPMQQVFGERLGGWLVVLAVATLLVSLVYVRFWCSYFCPVGALLALGNRFAPLQRLAPRRRLEHCDLGVRTERDLDCIRCGRCLDAEDTRLGNRPTGHRTKHLEARYIDPASHQPGPRR